MTDTREMVVTLGCEAAVTTREIAAERDLTVPEVIRRGLMLLVLLYKPEDGESLAVVNTKTGSVRRLRTDW